MQLLLNSIISSCVILHIGLSFSIIYYSTRFFHLAHGAVYTVGAYTGLCVLNYFVSDSQIIPDTSTQICIYGASAFIAMIIAGIVGALIDRVFYKPLRKRKAPNFIFLLASFGIFIFLQNFIALIYGNQVQSLRIGPIREGYSLMGAVITPIQIFVIMSSMSIFVFLSIVIKYCKIGKAIRAVADSHISASIVGIDPEKIILFVFILGSALAGLSGVLVSLETNLEPSMGFGVLLKGIVAAIIGGIGSFPGVLLGALVIGVVENLAISFLPSGCEDAIVLVILVLFLMFRPQGILGKREERAG